MGAAEVRLIAVDLDGTLLDSRRQITPACAEAVAQVRARGARVVLASARPPRSAMPFYTQLGLRLPMICYNGALVWDPHAREALLHVPLALEVAREVVTAARRRMPEVLVSAEVLDRWYTDRFDGSHGTQTSLLFRPDVVGPIDTWLTGPVTKLLLLGDTAPIASLCNGLREHFAGRITLVQTEGDLLQITSPAAGKAAALELLAGRLGVPRSAVLAIGDNANDMEMLRWAGLSVAMANAPPTVRAAARQVCESCDCDGVAKTLRRLVLMPQA